MLKDQGKSKEIKKKITRQWRLGMKTFSSTLRVEKEEKRRKGKVSKAGFK